MTTRPSQIVAVRPSCNLSFSDQPLGAGLFTICVQGNCDCCTPYEDGRPSPCTVTLTNVDSFCQRDQLQSFDNYQASGGRYLVSGCLTTGPTPRPDCFEITIDCNIGTPDPPDGPVRYYFGSDCNIACFQGSTGPASLTPGVVLAMSGLASPRGTVPFRSNRGGGFSYSPAYESPVNVYASGQAWRRSFAVQQHCFNCPHKTHVCLGECRKPRMLISGSLVHVINR
jgi:hypothetical protein